MSIPRAETVDACLEWLGVDADTVAEDPNRTIRVSQSAGDESWTRAEALLSTALSGDGPKLIVGEPLGQGGEGIVLLAEQRSLGRKVAVKTLRPDRGSHEARVGLLREAWLLGRLEHPNILPVHDLAAGTDGRPQVVLKRIEGIVWAEVIGDAEATRERFANELTEHNLEVLLKVCQAVRFAHSRGVVHRDLKPANVMIGAFGEVYLLDWGIAVVVDDEGVVPRVAAGTPAYMAPEMVGVAGMAITFKTDVYLLGAILFEVLCGRPPHDRPEQRDVIESILSSPPSIRGEVPEDLAKLAIAAMSPDPAERPTVEEFRTALLDHRRIRTSFELADEAERGLAELEAMVDQQEWSLERAYDRHGACRFGFAQALAVWGEHPTAQHGLRRTGCAMVRLELARGDALAARAQLERIDAPPDKLVAEVDAARARASKELVRRDALERLGDQHDVATGRDVRLLFAMGIGVLWVLGPLIALYGEHHGYIQPYPGILAPLVYLVIVGLGVVKLHGVMLRTVHNRRVLAVFLAALVGTLVMSLGALEMGLSPLHGRVLQLVVAGMAASSAALAVDRRFLWAVGGYALGFGLAVTWLHGESVTLVVHSTAHLVTTIVVYVTWRHPPKDVRERYGVRLPRGDSASNERQ
jgi:eukaryotic-like serine/threonine-protein kinase